MTEVNLNNANSTQAILGLPNDGVITTAIWRTKPEYEEAVIIDTIIKEDCIEILYKAEPNASYNNSIITAYSEGQDSPPVKAKIWKDVYGVSDGKFGKIKTIEGVYTPEQVIAEDYSFD